MPGKGWWKQSYLVARPLDERQGPEAPTEVRTYTEFGALIAVTRTKPSDWVRVQPVPGDRHCYAVWPHSGGHTCFFMRRSKFEQERKRANKAFKMREILK